MTRLQSFAEGALYALIALMIVGVTNMVACELDDVANVQVAK